MKNCKSVVVAVSTLLLLFGIGCDNRTAALNDAIKRGSVDAVAKSIKRGATLNPERRAFMRDSPLSLSCSTGNLQVVRLLVESGAKINDPVAYGNVPLMRAHEEGHRSVIEYLVESGADVNASNSFGVTPFIGFCAGNESGLVDLALSHGGDPNARFANSKGELGYTATQAAVVYGVADSVELLIRAGGDLGLRDVRGNDCVDLAKKRGDASILKVVKHMTPDVLLGETDIAE